MALIHRIAGLDGLLLATVTILAGLYAWVAHRLIRTGIHVLLTALVVTLAMAASSFHFHPRPHLTSIVLLGWTFARLCDFEAVASPSSGSSGSCPCSSSGPTPTTAWSADWPP